MITYDKEELLRATENPESWKALTEKYYELQRYFEKELQPRRREYAVVEHKKRLQKLKQGATLWFTANNEEKIPYGTECRKVSNGAKRMRVVIAGKHWMVHYSHLTADKPSDTTITVNRRLAKILTI